jgi:uncharacterized membrane protein YgdD (TMEM256/DUF423 family)
VNRADPAALPASQRLLSVLGGLCGAAGVALSALAAHRGGGNLGIAASFLLAHAPALLAIGLAAHLTAGRALLKAGGWVLFLGLMTFSGDLVMRDMVGHRLFPMAAPSGGTLMILGWLIIAAAALRRGTSA